uniref:Uncharacterized protein n=1 Tax=Physcomitrium patens TaxID=3218 RepID=A0A2K1IV47_PHYPA|nr:hypothetical protein PHYPA_025093 [Physcomitrium patens]
MKHHKFIYSILIYHIHCSLQSSPSMVYFRKIHFTLSYAFLKLRSNKTNGY